MRSKRCCRWGRRRCRWRLTRDRLRRTAKRLETCPTFTPPLSRREPLQFQSLRKTRTITRDEPETMPRTPEQAYAELTHRFTQNAILESCTSVLGWDEQTYMPPGGAAHRANQLSLL